MWLAVSKLRHEWRDALLGGFARTANFSEDESFLFGVRFAIGSGSESLGRPSWSSCWRHLYDPRPVAFRHSQQVGAAAGVTVTFRVLEPVRIRSSGRGRVAPPRSPAPSRRRREQTENR